VLKGIAEENRDDVHRLLKCLVVAIRPLRVEELAEVLAINFDGADGIPKLNPDWRWEDEEEALQASCSSLIAIVNTGDSRVVQFSHFSVKEFLTSPRLTNSNSNVSLYHISLEHAHTILAQSCLCVLLRLPVGDQLKQDSTKGKEDRYNTRDSFPLAVYAARHWVNHAQFGNVSSHIWKGMELLFNPNKPQFSTWLKLYNVDSLPDSNFRFANYDQRLKGTPLYYAALWGLHDLTEHLIIKHSQDVNAHGGLNVTPLGAALAGKHLQLAELLFRHGAALDVQNCVGVTLLHEASKQEDPEILQWLLSHGLDPCFHGGLRTTPLHWAAISGKLETTRILLQHNADAKAQGYRRQTPLHHASMFGHPDVAQLLLGHGADVNARDRYDSTPLHLASQRAFCLTRRREGMFAVARLLLEHGADRSAVDNRSRTAFQVAKKDDEMMQLLSEHISH
jgi:Ankyrin repeats (3 copies)/Ankyrin repeat